MRKRSAGNGASFPSGSNGRATGGRFDFAPNVTAHEKLGGIVGGLTVEAVDFFRKIKLKWIVAMGMLLIHFVVSNFNPGVDVNFLNLGKRPFLFFVNGVIGSYAIIAVSIVLCEWRELKPLIWIGENSLFIMATHLPWKVTTGITWMISRVVKFKQATAGYYFVIIFALILSLLAEKVLLTVWKGLAGLLNKHV